MTLLGRIFHTGCERTTSVDKAVYGLAAGAATGALLVGIPLAFTMGSYAIFALFFAFLIWAVGLVFIGAPGWWVLHKLGARCQQAAMIYGGGLTTLVVVLIGGWPAISKGRFDQLVPLAPWFAALAVIGVIVGWVVAKIAYAPEPTTAA